MIAKAIGHRDADVSYRALASTKETLGEVQFERLVADLSESYGADLGTP